MLYRFESSVNPEGIQTQRLSFWASLMFESSVNPEGIQTGPLSIVNGT